MSKNGVTQCGIRESRQHRDLDCRHGVSCSNSKGCKAEDAVALGINEGFHEAARLGKCLSTEYCNHRSLRQSVSDAALLRFRLTQADAGKLRVREHAKRHLPGGGRAMSAKNIVMHHVEIIFRDVREMRAAGTFSRGPTIGRCCAVVLPDVY